MEYVKESDFYPNQTKPFFRMSPGFVMEGEPEPGSPLRKLPK